MIDYTISITILVKDMVLWKMLPEVKKTET